MACVAAACFNPDPDGGQALHETDSSGTDTEEVGDSHTSNGTTSDDSTPTTSTTGTSTTDSSTTDSSTTDSSTTSDSSQDTASESSGETGDPNDPIGRPCAIPDDEDVCGASATCFAWGEATEGTCFELCDPEEGACACTPVSVQGGGQEYICLQECNPLADDCADGEGCYSSLHQVFVCAIDASLEGGEHRDPCEYSNACTAGLVCVPSEVVGGCSTNFGGCCTPYCSVANPSCAAGSDCVPWYADETAPEGLEDVGYCN